MSAVEVTPTSAEEPLLPATGTRPSGVIVLGLLAITWIVVGVNYYREWNVIPRLTQQLTQSRQDLANVKRELDLATQPSPVSAIPTHVRLKFGSGNSPTSTLVEEKNVWYYTWWNQAIIVGTAPLKKRGIQPQIVTTPTPRTWMIFLAFNKPISYSQIRIDGNGASLPYYEFKETTTRVAVIYFQGDLAGVVLDIECEP